MKYMMCYGVLYSMKNIDYKRFLENRAAGGEMTVPGYVVDRRVMNVTDLTVTAARAHLNTFIKRT